MHPIRPNRRFRTTFVTNRGPSTAHGNLSGSDLGQLMRLIGTGDQAAFAALYDELAGLVHGIARRVVRDPSQAEEVAQEVFLEIWRLAPRHDPDRGSVRSWVATIAHRRSVDRVRRSQSARNRDQREVDLRPAPVDSTDESVVDRFERVLLRRALTSLSALQREAVELAYFDGLTYREVATRLDTPEGTVKTRIRDGLRRLRAELGP